MSAHELQCDRLGTDWAQETPLLAMRLGRFPGQIRGKTSENVPAWLSGTDR